MSSPQESAPAAPLTSPATSTTPAPTPAVASPPHRWLALVGIALGVALVIMDATIANVALPVVIRDLGLNATQTQWMNAVYSLVFGSLILLAGRLADLYGRRLAFIIGLVVFMTSSLGVGLATSGVVIIAARIIQGMGAALVMPSTLSSINALFQGRERGIAFAVYGSMIGGMAAVGPLIGGWLATDVSWRWAFWLNIPFGLVALALTLRFVPETRDPHIERGVDLPGATLATLGMGGIVFGLIESSAFGWLTADDGGLSPVPVALAVGVSALAVFVVVERRRDAQGRVVLAHLEMFAIPAFGFGSLAAMVVALGEFGMLFVLPLLLQGAMGYDAIATGWILMALAGGTFVSSGLVPQVTKVVGRRTVVRVGLALEAAAIAGLALALPVGHWGVAGFLAVYGVGVGFATAQLTNVVLADVPVERSGEASGMLSTVRQLGTSLGVALIGGLLIARLTAGTREGLAGAPGADQLVTAVHDSVGAAIPVLATDPRTAGAAEVAADVLIAAARTTTGIAAGILLLGLLVTFALPPQHDGE